jgi:hypothetical protein
MAYIYGSIIAWLITLEWPATSFTTGRFSHTILFFFPFFHLLKRAKKIYSVYVSALVSSIRSSRENSFENRPISQELCSQRPRLNPAGHRCSVPQEKREIDAAGLLLSSSSKGQQYITFCADPQLYMWD